MKMVLLIIIAVSLAVPAFSQNNSNVDLFITDSSAFLSKDFENKLSEMKHLIDEKLLDSAQKILLDSSCIFDDQIKYNFLGVIAYQKKDFKSAEKYWLKSAVDNNLLYQTFKNLGMLYGFTGKIDMAISYYEQALEIIGESDSEILLNLAYLYRTNGDYYRALILWDAIKIKVPYLYSESEVAYIYSILGEKKIAISLFEDAEKQGDLQEWGYISLVQLYENISVVNAVKTSKKGIIKFPESNSLKYECLRILIDNRLFDDAGEFIKYHSLEDSQNAKIAGLVLDYFISVNDKSKLKRFYNDTLKLDKESTLNLVRYLYKEAQYNKIVSIDSVSKFASKELGEILAKSFYALNKIDDFNRIVTKIYSNNENNVDDELLILYGFANAFLKNSEMAKLLISSVSSKDGETKIRVLKKIFNDSNNLELVEAISSVFIVSPLKTKDYPKEILGFVNLLNGNFTNDTLKFSSELSKFNINELKGDIFFRNAKYKEALEMYKQSRYEQSDEFYILYKQSLCYNRLNEIEKSKSILKELIDTEKYNQEYLHKIFAGYYFAENGYISDAIKVWQSLKDDGIKDYNLSRNLALAHSKNGEFELGVSILKKIYEENPDSSKILVDISNVYKESGDEELALLYLPFDRFAFNKISADSLKILYKQKIMEESNCLEKELVIFNYYIEFGEFNNAIKFFEKSEYINDYNLEISLDYASALITTYEFKKAYKFLKKIEHHKSDRLHYLQVVALCQANKSENAISIINKIKTESYKLSSEIIYYTAQKKCIDAEKSYKEFKKKGYNVNFFNIPLGCK